MKILFSMAFGSAFTIFVIWWTAVPERDVYAAGYADGRKNALRLNPVGEDLEMACAGLWFGKHGEIYYKMRKDHGKHSESN